MAKYLDYLLPVYHFFHIAVYISKGFLLHDKEYSDLARYDLYDLQDKKHCDNRNKCKPYADVKHTDKYRNDGKHRRNELCHRLCNHLAECIGVISVKAHNIAVSPCIKRADGKPLHFLKHLVPDRLQCTLCYRNHHTIVEQGRKHSDKIYDANYGKSF